MEPIGFAIGVVGLGGLVSTCIHSYAKLQHMLNMAEETDFAINKMDIERIRFLQWAESCRDTDNCSKTSRRTGSYADPVIQKTLQHMLISLGRAATLQQKYGVTDRRDSRNYNKNGNKIGFRSKVGYAISGREEFEEIIAQLSYYNERLPTLIPSRKARQEIARALSRRPQLFEDDEAWDNDDPPAWGNGAAGVAAQIATTMEHGLRRRREQSRDRGLGARQMKRVYFDDGDQKQAKESSQDYGSSRPRYTDDRYQARYDGDDDDYDGYDYIRRDLAPPPSYSKSQYSSKSRHSNNSYASNISRKSNSDAAREMWGDLTFRNRGSRSTYR
ncbi:uncharacterized protein AB675_11444 [Cyphellophora attinorum]|uniref:Prion-inhibition and propagation HeLo domain-containing protein n=1 Tax=Cyphellophora attinorum TaxID=1664694 RepID=A0A0N1H3Z2_9EURO|nr:uncharacterized protein AB675_11444 [Phialophora attinorum]KPI39893.1 hypothetical protein AB675_11444 [Phialophora attinorum]